MIKLKAKDVKERIRKNGNSFNISNKEFFEIKRRLFPNEEDKSKKEYTYTDIDKFTFAKILIELGYTPQKAVDKINEMWNHKNLLIDEILKEAKNKKKHIITTMDDIVTTMNLYKSYLKYNINLPIIQSDGISNYQKKVSDEVGNILVNNANNLIDEDYEKIIELMKIVIDLKKDNVLPNSIRAKSLITKYYDLMKKIFGMDAKIVGMSIMLVINDDDIKKFAKENFDYDEKENGNIAEYIKSLIGSDFIVNFTGELYDITRIIVDENALLNPNIYELNRITSDKENIEKYKEKLFNLLKEYYIVFDKYEDSVFILNDLKSTVETNMTVNDELTKNNDFQIYLNLLNIAIFILKEYK